MSLTQINNGDSGLDARNKINTAFGTVDTLSTNSWSSATTYTNNDTTTNLYFWFIESPDTQAGYNAMTVRASVVGYNPAGGSSKAYGAELFGTFYNQGGTYSYQIGTTDVIEKTSFDTATSHLSLGNEGAVILTVTGEPGTSIWWTADFKTLMTTYID